VPPFIQPVEPAAAKHDRDQLGQTFAAANRLRERLVADGTAGSWWIYVRHHADGRPGKPIASDLAGPAPFDPAGIGFASTRQFVVVVEDSRDVGAVRDAAFMVGCSLP
jgi:hypothetical protein